MSTVDERISLGYWIRRRRKALDLTQAKLAQQVGCAVATIKKIEADERRPSPLMAERLAECLGIPAEERAAFLRVARAAVALHRLATPLHFDTSAPSSPAGAEASVPISRQPHNLPHRLTSFVGREQEVAALQRLVQEQRLVTLTGVGGVGKSSLALAVANTLAFPDGVWLLELASLNESSLVARTLASLFQLPEFPGRTPLEAVISYLQHKKLLLIVDNCEHLIATCADLVERLLQTSAKLHILATSREVLNIAGEHEWPVLPLSTPPRLTPDESAWSLTKLQPFAAAQLFIERAQAVKADLVFTDQDAPLIAHLCQQLDGIPLALELAAARCKSFALAEIVARLQDRFVLLSAGRRTALLRHQTLRATIDWSYDLLSPAEAALFRCLSVFVGGWTVAAAEAVADPSQSHPSTFDLLYQLVNKSLVVVDQRDETTRYHMLETIRQYARKKLAEQGETETACARHFACCLAMVENAMPTTLLGAQFYQWCDEVKADLDNLRAAFAWSQTQADESEKSLHLATGLGLFWEFQLDASEGRIWLENALAHADPENTELTSWGIVWLAYTLLSATPRAFELATEALKRFTALNQPAGIALANLLLGRWAAGCGESAKAIRCLQAALVWFEAKQSLFFLERTYFYLGDAFVSAGKRKQALHYYRLDFQLGEDMDDYEVVIQALEGIAAIDPTQAIALCQKHLEQQRQRQNKTGEAALLYSLGRVLAFADELTGAVAALTESLALWLKLGIPWSRSGGIARTCLQLGRIQHQRQEYQLAIAHAQQALQIFTKAGVLNGLATAHIVLGYAALAVNDLTLALSSFHSSLDLVIEKDLDRTYVALMGLAEIARRQTQFALAARLFGVAERFARRINPFYDRWKEVYCGPLLAAAYTDLRDGAYAAAWAEGQAMSLDQAMQLALTFK